MTDSEQSQVVQQAADPALLSGRNAKFAMYLFACLLAVGPLLYYIPDFPNWRDVVGYLVAVGMAIASPTITLLIPKDVQEQYRQALLDADARNQQLHDRLQEMRATFERPPTERTRATDRSGGTP